MFTDLVYQLKDDDGEMDGWKKLAISLIIIVDGIRLRETYVTLE